MTREQLIDKWEKQLALWLRTGKEKLFYTKEERYKAFCYSSSIAEFLADLKEMDTELIK